jgi:hypothetical protein
MGGVSRTAVEHVSLGTQPVSALGHSRPSGVKADDRNCPLWPNND